jgi:hypothetical protein
MMTSHNSISSKFESFYETKSWVILLFISILLSWFNIVFHIFAYLKELLRSRIIIDETMFVQGDWTEFYKDAQKAISPNAPQLQCNRILISSFVDAHHSGNQVTHISPTGILIINLLCCQ